MEAKMRAFEIDRAQVIRDTCIVTTGNIASHPRLGSEFDEIVVCAALYGASFR
jgi:hypothetical protein